MATFGPFLGFLRIPVQSCNPYTMGERKRRRDPCLVLYTPAVRVLRLLPNCCWIMDCDGIGRIVIIVCVGAVVFLIAGGVRQCCFVIGLSVDLI